jgi:hypothetical protein
MPDLELVTANGPLRVFTLLHNARPVLLNLGAPGAVDITPWADRVQLIDAEYTGTWELPVLGAVAAPTGVLIRPDGYVAWPCSERSEGSGLIDAHHLVWNGGERLAAQRRSIAAIDLPHQHHRIERAPRQRIGIGDAVNAIGVICRTIPFVLAPAARALLAAVVDEAFQ